jgi:acetyl coenzyme A synthetase (ADP forming)-like protein
VGTVRPGTNGWAPVDVILHDGTALSLRPPRHADSGKLVTFFSHFSPDALYLRFHGFPTVDSRLVEPIVEPDWSEHGSLVALSASGRGERVVGIGNYIRTSATTAEAAFAIAEDFRARGLGTRILEQLAKRARKEKIETFVAYVLPGNNAMLRVLEESGFRLGEELEGGVIEVRLALDAGSELEARSGARDHVAVRNSLLPLFRPRAVAVIGASRRPGSIGGELFRNILRSSFDGSVYPVNREGRSVAGVHGYCQIDQIRDEIELAVICVPAASVLEVAEQALRAGVRALCVITAGFREVGPEGQGLEERLLTLVRAHGARLLGPNCLGLSSAETRLNATFASTEIPFGDIAFCSQSGALGLALVEHATWRGLGLSAFVSVGNKADVSSNDLLEYWEDDEATRLILLYLEGFGNPRKFGRLARRVARTKPILALHGGASAEGAQAAGSHTAALASSPEAVRALFRQAGVIQAESLEELIDVAELLTTQPLPAGRRVAILTNAGGLGVLCADACASSGLTLATLGEATLARLREVCPEPISPSNPLDILGSAPAPLFAKALEPLLDDDDVDSVVVLFAPPVSATSVEVARELRTTIDAQSERAKPVLGVLFDGGAARPELDKTVCLFDFPGAATRALARASERAEWLAQPLGTPDVLSVDRAAVATVVERSLELGERWLDPDEALAILEAYGIPTVPQRLCADGAEAVDAARALGFPVALKSAIAGEHKTERGGVVLDLADDAAVGAAFERVGASALVQPMIGKAAELLVGVLQDPRFGPIVAAGPGGVLAELIADANLGLAPLTDADAAAMLDHGRLGKVVAGYRGPALDREALIDLLLRVSQLADDFPEIAELDLNPVMATADALFAVDARIRVRPSARAVLRKTW